MEPNLNSISGRVGRVYLAALLQSFDFTIAEKISNVLTPL